MLLLLIMLVPVLSIQYYLFVLPAASFLNAALCWSICVWILNKSPKRHLPRGFLFIYIHSPSLMPVCLSLLHPPAPRRWRGILFYLCPSFRPSKVFSVAFFSVTVDGRNHKHHIGIPYCGYRFWTRQIPTSCLPT